MALFETVIGGVAGFGIRWVWTEYHDWKSRPKLQFDYDDNRDEYRFQTQDERILHNNNKCLSHCCYVSIRVTNTRRKTARKVCGFLKSVEKKENGEWNPTAYCHSLPLQWSFRSQSDAVDGISIGRGVDQFLNVFKFSSDESGIRPTTVPYLFQDSHLFPFRSRGEFRFTIQVSADDVLTDTFGLRVKWEREWSEVWKDHKNLLEIRQDTTVGEKP